MKLCNYFLGLVLILITHTASAIPLTATDDSGYRGEGVEIILTDPTADGLDTLWLDILFDANALTFGEIVSSTLSSITVDDTAVASGKVSALLSSSNNPYTGDIELLQALFTIRGTADFGVTEVGFRCAKDEHDVDVGCFDYSFKPVSARITVLQSTQIPLPATIWLLVLGFSILAGMRMRR